MSVLKSSSRRSKSDSSEEFKFLNQDEIAARRIPLEDSLVEEKAQHGKWYCDFCSTRFTLERAFMKHNCKKRERYNKLRSPIGQAAFGYYKEWMRLQQFGQPGIDAFQDSRYFNKFFKFAEFVQTTSMTRPEKYIELMISGTIDPALWCSPNMYSAYIKWADSLRPPLVQVEESISALIDICEREKVELSNVFEHLGSQRTLQLIRQRKLSPWFLFCCTTFNDLSKKFDDATMKAFGNIVSPMYWHDQFSKKQKVRDEIKQIIREMGL